MTLTYSLTDDFKVIVKTGTKKIDEVGPFDSAEGADAWAIALCAKYNSPEYSAITYPNQITEQA